MGTALAQDTVRIRDTIERLNVILVGRQYAPLVLASS
jgi:hypothetical protein